MDETRFQQAKEKITGLQPFVIEAKNLIKAVVEEEDTTTWDPMDMEDVRQARSELNKAAWSLGGSFAALSRLQDRELRRQKALLHRRSR